MPTLADIYSAADSFKRRLSDAAMNPGATLQQMLGYANDRARVLNEMTSAAAQEKDLYGPATQRLGQKLADAYNPAGMVANPGYGMSHRPMTVEGGASRLHEAYKSFGEDVYSPKAMQYFGSNSPLEKQSLQIIQKMRNKPNEMVTIYRGVPKDVKENTINPGDWIALDPNVAKEYGEKVLSMKVPASHITTWPDSLAEFGYYPK